MRADQRARRVFADPHVQARGTRIEMPHSMAGDVPLVANPIRLSESPVQYRQPPPTLGQHTEEVLRDWLAASSAQIDALRTRQAK